MLGKGSNNSPCVLAGDLGEHREAGIPFDQSGDVRVVRSGKKISFPMSRHGAILNLGWPLADGDHIEDAPLSTLRVAWALMMISSPSSQVKLNGRISFYDGQFWVQMSVIVILCRTR